MRKSLVASTFVALAFTLIPASRASAAQIDFTGGGKGAWVTFSLANDPLGNPFSDWVGELNWNWVGGAPAGYDASIYTYCVDATQYLRDPQTVTLESTDSLTMPGDADAGKRVAWLVNQFANQVHTSGTADQAAGLQVAIWEAEYDKTANLSGGNFQLVTSGAVLTAANTYLSALYSNPLPGGGSTYYTSQATFLDTASGQDQVTLNPVPEPASFLLVGSGAAVAYMRRRRRKMV
jgi:PEP-CTERM motif-containing protein